MFAYSLSGLEISDDAGGVTEVEENEITARSAVYQVLGRIFTAPDTEHYEMAGNGQWVKELTEAAALLDFEWDIGEFALPDEADKAAHVAEYDRLFLVASGDGKRIWGGARADDRDQMLTELGRSYEYYGLGGAGEDVPLDHLTAELDFMQFLTFKEAAASSPRLGRSFRRAQVDFLAKQLDWVTALAAEARDDDPSVFWAWALDRLESFLEADTEAAAG